ncbi:PrsW family intramembrane metalloprotease [Enterovirga sp.]|uniref:PrsW family intramembrane metalloprotease n=1 Tax=Enterovirga sp. TaxID=2026350 RepID=UPI0026206DC2|nr:PrsW family intramembrane metalloprotease [Enterovirga sp.]MDB5589671.1 domain containing protein [Enterovirga sp.]
MSQVPALPPPRPGDVAPTLSEMIPFGSRKISIWRSTALMPLVLVAVTSVVLFNLPRKTAADFTLYMNVVAASTLLFTFLLLYIYGGERKNPLWYAIPAVVTVLQLDLVLGPYIWFFRKVLPGDLDGNTFVTSFVGMFFGAGLMEEIMKGVPLLIGLAVALWLRRTGSPGGVLSRGIAVQGPMDGLLMGAAAGAGFIMIETMTMYVPRTVKAFKDPEMGLLVGMSLMIPRVIKGVIGHMAYAGIFGYFIGLAATHSRHAVRLVLIGLLLSATLHAFWNSASDLHPTYGPYLSAALITFVFFGCLLKARQLEASRLGGYIDGRSILALSPQYRAEAAMPGIVPPPAGGLVGVFTGVTTLIEKSVGTEAKTTVPAAGPAAVPESGLAIGIGERRYALAPGQPVDFSALFGAEGVPAGCSGLIGAAPDGAFHIRNVGTATWAVFGPDGAAETVAPGRDAAVGAGTRIVLGDASVAVDGY